MKKAFYLGVPLLLVVYYFLPKPEPTRLPASESIQSPICKTIPSSNFSIDRFMEEMRTNSNIKSVEDALCLIPTSVRSSYVLVHSSRSAQGSQPRYPRAILYKTNKKHGVYELDYAISFNGSPDDTNFNNIEVVKANSRAKEGGQHFEYFDIEFSEDNQTKPHVSESNPQQCMMCHAVNTTRARAIWDAKGFTPHVYGASTFGGGIGDEKHIEAFKKFVANAPNDSRYSYLSGLDKIEIQGKRIKNLENSNSVFAEALGTVNNRRIVSLIKETNNYEKYKYAILAAVSGCQDITQFVPDKLHTNHSNLSAVEPEFRDPGNHEKIYQGYERFAKMTGRAMPRVSRDEGVDSAVIRLGAENMSPKLIPYLHDLEAKVAQWGTMGGTPVVGLRWLIEGRGMDMEEWAMDVPLAGNFGFYRLINSRYQKSSSVGDQSPDNFRIMQFMIESDNDLKMAFANSAMGMDIRSAMNRMRMSNPDPLFSPVKRLKYCDDLKKKSLRSLRWLNSNDTSDKARSPIRSSN